METPWRSWGCDRRLHFRAATRQSQLRPVHNNLGVALSNQGKNTGVAEWEAIRRIQLREVAPEPGARAVGRGPNRRAIEEYRQTLASSPARSTASALGLAYAGRSTARRVATRRGSRPDRRAFDDFGRALAVSSTSTRRSNTRPRSSTRATPSPASASRHAVQDGAVRGGDRRLEKPSRSNRTTSTRRMLDQARSARR
jgi:hypothetical protein